MRLCQEHATTIPSFDVKSETTYRTHDAWQGCAKPARRLTRRDRVHFVSLLAQAAGVPAKTIRFYESAGIMPSAARRPNGYREYGADDLCRLRLVAALRGLGLGLGESGELAALCVGGRCDEMAAQLHQRVVDRRREIAAHQAALAHLDAELANLEAGLGANAPVRALCIGEGGDDRAAL